METIKVYDIWIQDRTGLGTWVWVVYHNTSVMTVEFTKNAAGFTERVDLAVARA